MTFGPHLQRLARVWIDQPVYFITICAHRRQPRLAEPPLAALMIDEWRACRERHGWHIGRFVIMPDHVHFFAAPEAGAKPLSRFVGRWKEWTAKRAQHELRVFPPLWQTRFFDHLLRSAESRSEKWEYVRQNPIRAGLVAQSDQWPYQGWIDFE